jgi:hypothetical protein
MNDGARQALVARVSWAFADHASACSHDSLIPIGTGTGGEAPDKPIALVVFFLGAMVMKNYCSNL